MDPSWIVGAEKWAAFAAFLLILLTIWGRVTHTLHLFIPIIGWIVFLFSLWLGFQMMQPDIYVMFANWIHRTDVSDAVIFLAAAEVLLVAFIWFMVAFALFDILKGLFWHKSEHEKNTHPLQ